MNKSDLKTGMVAEFRNGQRALVLVGDFETSVYGKQEIIFSSVNFFMTGDRYTQSLNHTTDTYSKFDVMRLYKAKLSHLGQELKDHNLELIWERPDWPTVPVDTKVLVRDGKSDRWVKRHFCKYEDNRFYCYANGKTSFTVDLEMTAGWNQCVLFEENEHLEGTTDDE